MFMQMSNKLVSPLSAISPMGESISAIYGEIWGGNDQIRLPKGRSSDFQQCYVKVKVDLAIIDQI